VRRSLRIGLAVVGLAAVVYGAASLTGGWLGEPPWWTKEVASTSVHVFGKDNTLAVEQPRDGRELISAAMIVVGLVLVAWAAWSSRRGSKADGGSLPVDPGTSEHRDLWVGRLRHATQRLALDPAALLAQFPTFVECADELAMDFEHALLVCSSWGYLESRVSGDLAAIDSLLGSMSGPHQADRWTDDALTTDPGWLEVRAKARAALRVAGWPLDLPPTPEQEGASYVT
jgi:hypothetical protein